MKKIIEADGSQRIGMFFWDLFMRPFIAMVAWGAFIHITEINLPAFGYWAVFMLNLVVVIIKSSQIRKWIIR